MKRTFTLVIFSFILFSCKKEISQAGSDGFLQKVKTSLKDSLSIEDYATLDFAKAVLNKVDSVQLYFFRIPFRNKTVASDFVLVKMTKEGMVEQGKIIHLNGNVHEFGEGKIKRRKFDGNISISSLNRKQILNSSIEDGYITAFHSNINAKEQLMEANVMPEVVIVAYVHYDTGIDFSTWLWLQNLMYDYGGGGSGNTSGGYYGSDGGGYSNGGGGGYNYNNTDGGGDVTIDQTIELEPEYIYSLARVDLTKIFKCFDNIPSAGATYSIKLCADIPSNGNPNASSNSSAVSGGHTFLIITKANNNESVTQSFGFYPLSAPSWLDPFAPVTSTIKDNGAQEINARIGMSISESQFNTIKQNAISWSAKNYELGDYNCTNYAMDIFNSVRANPISIAPYKVILPGSTNPWGPSDPITVTIEKSPQMLFSKLLEMKNNSSEASNIIIDQTHNTSAPISKGECN